MSAIIPPRRNEFITKDGLPTQRFIEYLEQLTTQTNDSEVQIDLTSSVLPRSSCDAGTKLSESQEMTRTQSGAAASDMSARIDALELILIPGLNAQIDALKKQLDELSILISQV